MKDHNLYTMIKKHKSLVRFCKILGHWIGIYWPDDYIRVGRKASDPSIHGLKKVYYKLMHRRLTCKMHIEIPNFSNIGERFNLAHPSAIVIHEDAKIGKNCLIFKGVSIGVIRGGKREGVPVIEDRVVVCANAVVFGGVTIGHDTLIAADTFVDFDVPPHSLVIGNPGVIHAKEFASKAYLPD